MRWIPDRFLSVWRRALALGWPVAVQQLFNTLMRTVDILVTGLFSPAAIAAIGLADLYAQVPLRVGLGLGTGAIAISSQDTGRGAVGTRNRAITQALLLGFLCGLPFVAVGLLFGTDLIALLGADSAVVSLGGLYLAIVFAAAPMRIVGLVGARSLQGTGDTRTPMAINVGANLLNISLTVTLGLGLWIAPELGVAGVGIGTFVSRTVEGLSVLAVFAAPRGDRSLARPRSFTITRQLVGVSVPNFAEGMSTSVANFPFNALLLTFGTGPNAAYHVSRRLYQQLAAPFSRSFSTVSSIIVGQTLGEGDPDRARYQTGALLALSLLVLGSVGVVVFLGAGLFVRIFTRDAAIIDEAIAFTRVFAVSMLFVAIFYPLSGALRGAGDTRTPFYARFLGSFVFMLGVSYLLGIALGYGLAGTYIGVGLSFACWAGVVMAGVRWGNWIEKATVMIEQRAETE